MLPAPQPLILPEFDRIIKAFTNPVWMGEMRARWNEIKKLRHEPSVALAV